MVSEVDCPTTSTYALCCGARTRTEDGPKITLIHEERGRGQGSKKNGRDDVENIDIPGREAPRPMALERAMKTVLAHEECWDEWLNILDPAAARAIKKSDRNEASSTSASSSGRDNASSGEYFRPDQTILIFDWDDTLFPSNWLQQSESFFKPSENHAKLFKQLASVLEPLMKLAMSLGKVIIVTNSSEPWVSISVRTFMPQLESLFENITTVYARAQYEKDPDSTTSSSMFGFRPSSMDVLAPQRWKEKAFQKELGGFYSRYSNQSWKNVVSIGDSIYERNAAKEVLLKRVKTGGQKTPCRLKTAKFMENPPVEDLIAQIRAIHEALGMLVQYDGNLDVELDYEDLKHGQSLAKKIVDPQFAGL